MTNEEFVVSKGFRENLWLIMKVVEHMDWLMGQPHDEESDSINMDALQGWTDLSNEAYEMMHRALAPYAMGVLFEEWREAKAEKEDAG